MQPVHHATPVGFVGLGNLGQAMALRLLHSGWSLSVCDPVRERAHPCAQAGARVASGPRDLAECGVVALAVPDDAAVRDVLESPHGLLQHMAEGSIVLLHSTVLPETVIDLHEIAGRQGVALLDVPVSGGADRAAEGQLTLMVGGDDAAVEVARGLLDSLGEDVRHVGPAGAGTAVKLANQLMMFSALAGAQEGLELAGAYGVRERDVLEVVWTSLGDSWVARNWGFFDQMADAYDRNGTPLGQRSWSKDLWDVVTAARGAGLRLPVAGLLSQYLADRVERHAAAARRQQESS